MPLGPVIFEVNPPANTAGTDFARIVVNGGDVDLSGATLTFSGSAGAVAAGKKVRIIDNTTAAKNTTASASPAEGATVGINGNNYRIFYHSGTNKNDVVLVRVGTPTTVYVDDGFAGSAIGDDIPDADLGTTGNQDATFGIDAFATINEALPAVAAGGTVVVNGGSYAETVSLTGTRTLRITGPDAAQYARINILDTDAGTSVQIVGAASLQIDHGTISGPVSGTGRLLKGDAGTLILSAANTYTGTTFIYGGILRVNGSITSDTTVIGLGTLGGNGTIIGNVTATGTVAPGNSPGTLHIVGDFTSLGFVVIEVNPPAATPGTDYDTIEVTGNVNLAGASLLFIGTGGFPNLLTTIIDNQGVNPTVPSTTPAEVVPPAAAVTINGVNYFIFCNGGDGNDVVLVQATTPTNVFVNDDWAALSNGTLIADVDPLVAGPQVGVKGVNAFADIAPALAVVTVGGTIEVLGNSAAGYAGFTLSNSVTFVLARDTFFPGGQDTVTINGAVNLDGQDFTPTLNQGAGLVNLRTTGGAPITGTSGTPSVAVTTTVANTGSVSLGGNVTAVLGVSLVNLDAITLGLVSTGTGGITTNSNGITTLNGNLSTDSGDVLLTAVGGVRTGASIAIDTEQGNDGSGGSVDLSAASVSSTEAGSNFTVNTGTMFAGGTGVP